MAYARGKRVPAQRRKAPDMQHKAFVAPTGGWVSAVNLAAAPKGTAQICENYAPTETGLAMRGGTQKKGRAATGFRLESAFSYVGTALKMFAAANGKIVNLSAPADPDITPAADVTGQTSNYYSTLNYATPGGQFLTAVNGTDFLQLYDGTTWQQITAVSAPAITGTATNKLSQVNAYRNRQWFVEGGTMNAHYLPVDSIGGALGDVSLSGVFKNGGSLLFSATWSMDAGDGLDDKIVFASTKGEFAVYQGDPGTDFSLVGRYDAAPPLGKNAFLQVGGDLLVLTEIGIVAMSQIQVKDPAALSLTAISKNIGPDWRADATARRGLPWEIAKWTGRNVAIISTPVIDNDVATPAFCYAVNLATGAWAKWTNLDTQCLVLHDGFVYFGRRNGTLIQMQVSGNDEGLPIEYTYAGQNEHIAGVGVYTSVMQARAVFKIKGDINPQLSTSVDYVLVLPPPPNAPVSTIVSSNWDEGLWDQAFYDNASEYVAFNTGWESIGMSGFVHAPQLQMTSSGAALPQAELILFEVTHEPGGIVV